MGAADWSEREEPWPQMKMEGVKFFKNLQDTGFVIQNPPSLSTIIITFHVLQGYEENWNIFILLELFIIKCSVTIALGHVKI